MNTIIFPNEIGNLPVEIGNFEPNNHVALLEFIDANNMDVCICHDNNTCDDFNEYNILNKTAIGYAIGVWSNRTLNVVVHMAGDPMQHIMINVLKAIL